MIGVAARLRAWRSDSTFDHRLIAPMILGSVLNPVNSSMLAVALVPIGVAFGAPPSETAWLVSALYLATAVGQPAMGRMVDLFGPRTLYLAATALVGVAGLVGALAPSLAVLVVSRVLLGFGTSAAFPASMKLIRSEAARTGMRSPAGLLSALSIANQVVVVLGPTAGGLLIGLGGWPLIFSINVPLSLACLVLGWLYLPRGTAGEGEGGRPATGSAAGVDLPGMLLFAGTLAALLLFLMQPRVTLLWLPVLGGAIGAVFVVRELRLASPFIDLRVLGGSAPLLATFGRMLLSAVTSYAFLYGYTQWLEEGRSLSASIAGLLLLPMSLSAIAITAAVGRRPAVRGKLLAGALLQVAACACMLLLGSASPIWLLAVIGVLVGLPQGLNGLANQNALYHQADPQRMGSSAGLLRTFWYLGALIAAAAIAGFFGRGAGTVAMHDLSWFVLAVAVVLLLVTAADRSLGRIGQRQAG